MGIKMADSLQAVVLGGAGYIGAPLCELLLKFGIEVTCVDSLLFNNWSTVTELSRNKYFRFIQSDVRDFDRYRNPLYGADVVFNLAAIVGAPACDKFPADAVDVNQTFVERLANVLCRSQQLVQFTTNSGYGMTDGTSEVDESSLLNPTSLYGRTKVAAEAAVMQRERSVSLRLATVFGVAPRMRYDLLVNDWTEKLSRNRRGKDFRLTIYEPKYFRNYVHVRDAARAAAYLFGRQLFGVYNVGNPEANCTKLELANIICQVLSIDPEVYVGVDLDGKDPDQRNYLVSNAKILGAGFKFENPLRAGIREVYEHVLTATEDSILKGRNV